MKIRIVISLACLLVGLLIYALSLIEISGYIPFFTFIRNYVPDLCWGISFYFASMSLIYKSFKSSSIYMASLYVMIIAIVFELLQLFHVINGYYDFYDILFYLLSVIVSCLTEKYIRRYKNEKS